MDLGPMDPALPLTLPLTLTLGRGQAQALAPAQAQASTRLRLGVTECWRLCGHRWSRDGGA